MWTRPWKIYQFKDKEPPYCWFFNRFNAMCFFFSSGILDRNKSKYFIDNIFYGCLCFRNCYNIIFDCFNF